MNDQPDPPTLALPRDTVTQLHAVLGQLLAGDCHDSGYCPHCGRGDAGPTADDYEQLRQRAERAEAEATAWAESDSADAAAGSYAHRAEQAEAALAALHEGEEPPPDENVQPTPAQWLWQWNRATPAQRLDMAGRVLEAFTEASTCFLMDHKGERPRRQAAEAALDRVTAAVASFNGRGVLGDPNCWPIPTAGEVLQAVRAALNDRQEPTS
ncbi:hypothetical protein [Streptomyces sp. NPDC090022]|uniref:hypothetical protein n=1 Tax=Streptomyces sp. NPDC090022 TaxID=3365920 RepID=UPI00381F7831